jgi:hypothetical protein
MTAPTTKIAGEAMTDERATFKEFRAALCRMNDANTPVSVADRVMILSNATFLLDEYARASTTAPAQSCGEDAAKQSAVPQVGALSSTLEFHQAAVQLVRDMLDLMPSFSMPGGMLARVNALLTAPVPVAEQSVDPRVEREDAAEQADEAAPGSPKETMENLTRQFSKLSDLERAVMYDFLARAKDRK